MPFKRSTECVCALKPNGDRNVIDGIAWNEQPPLCLSDAGATHKFSRCFPKNIREDASKIPRRHARSLRQRFDRKVLAKVAQDPGSKIRESID